MPEVKVVPQPLLAGGEAVAVAVALAVAVDADVAAAVDVDVDVGCGLGAAHESAINSMALQLLRSELSVV